MDTTIKVSKYMSRFSNKRSLSKWVQIVSLFKLNEPYRQLTAARFVSKSGEIKLDNVDKEYFLFLLDSNTLIKDSKSFIYLNPKLTRKTISDIYTSLVVGVPKTQDFLFKDFVVIPQVGMSPKTTIESVIYRDLVSSDAFYETVFLNGTILCDVYKIVNAPKNNLKGLMLQPLSNGLSIFK